jgi:sterol 14-demethylase
VLREQEEVGAFTASELTWDMVQNMQLLYNCIKETLRMWPPLIFLMRKAVKPIVRVLGLPLPLF